MVTPYHYDPMLWPTLGSAAFIGAIGLYLWRRRSDTKGALTLALVAFLLVLWCLGGAAEVATTDIATQRASFVFRDALTLPTLVLAFWFALQYAGLERWLIRPLAVVLVGVVIVQITLEFVAGGSLLWSGITWSGEVQGDRTPLGLAFSAFAIAVFVLATAVFLLLFVRSPAHRVPVALILLGQVALRVLYPIGVFNIIYVPNIVSGVVGFDCVTAMYALAVFRFRLFDLVPVARQTILQRMPDAMLVLDTEGRLVDLNAAARRLLSESPMYSGSSMTGLLRACPDVAAMLSSLPDASSEVVLAASQGQRTCQVARSPLTDWQGRSIGRLVVLHDITELRAAQDRLLEQERALTAAHEREQMARDLHDSLGQVLGYLGLQVAAIRKRVADGRIDDVDARLERVAAIAEDAQVDVRRTIADLARSPRQDADFVASLRARLDASERGYGIATSLVVAASAEGTDVPPHAAGQLLRIVEEALTNAIRHGRAREARVSLERDDGYLALAVEDDGDGFEPAQALAGGDGRYGLRFMRERAIELGGNLEITSLPGHGARVSVRVPLEAREGAMAP